MLDVEHRPPPDDRAAGSRLGGARPQGPRGHGARAARGVRAARLPRARLRRHERAARPRPEHAGAEARGPHPAGARAAAPTTPCSRSAPAAAISRRASARSPARCARSRSIPDLAAAARANLARADVHNVTVETADAFALGDAGRYDAVVLTGSLPRVRRALRAVARRRRPAVRRGRPGPGHGSPPHHPQRPRASLRRESLFETVMDPLVHAAEPPKFVF